MSSNQSLKKTEQEYLSLAEFEIRVIRSRRKSLCLQVKPTEIVIRSPQFSPRLALKAFALSKIDWLRKSQQRFSTPQSFRKIDYIHGDELLYMGDKVVLHTATGSKSSVHFDADIRRLSVVISRRVKNQQSYTKKAVIQWYKDQANAYLQQTIPHLAKAMRVSYQGMTVREYKARWGSCSSSGHLSFNWRIFMAPTSVIDSVIVHELAHIKYFNHSKQFWAMVYAQCPDYQQQHTWLKDNQYHLQQ